MSLRRAPLPLVLALALAACAADSGSAYERGVAAFAVGDMRTARVELLNAIQANPGNRRAPNGKLRLLYENAPLALVVEHAPVIGLLPFAATAGYRSLVVQ